jgi:DNA topoisomerase-1
MGAAAAAAARTKRAPAAAATRSHLSTSPRKYLLIVESPSKCAKIEEYLGSDYQCISSKGHIRTVDHLSQIDFQHGFRIDFHVLPEKEDHVRSMQRTVAQYPPESVLLATDDDREGEAIAWHICEVCALDVRTTKRIVFHEITKPALVAAVESPTVINLSLVYAQHARQVMDLLVGFKISPLLWRYVSRNKQSPLSAGRCQTPALRLVHDHAVEYKARLVAAGSGQRMQVHGTFTGRSLPFVLQHTFAVGGPDDGGSQRAEVRAFLEESTTFDHRMHVHQVKERYQSPPKPFNTSRLLQVASQTLHLSPKTTMSLAQTLYQMGLITYMRTDCMRYSRVFLDKAALFIQERYGNEYIATTFEPIELVDGTMPHEAVRCTNPSMQQFQHENHSLVRLYQLIWRNTVESCMKPYFYRSTELSIAAPRGWEYRHSVDIPLSLGWQRVTVPPLTTDAHAAGSGLLLYLTQLMAAEQPIAWSRLETKTTAESRLPPHYTEASLIQKMEDAGIGRPSTFSSLVETIQDRGYVKKTHVPGRSMRCEDIQVRPGPTPGAPPEWTTVTAERIFGEETDKLVIQPTGVLALEFLLAHFDDCFSYTYTKQMEDALDTLAAGTPEEAAAGWHGGCSDLLQMLEERTRSLRSLRGNGKPTFRLADRADMVLVFTSFGASLKRLETGGGENDDTAADTSEDDEAAAAAADPPLSTTKYIAVRSDVELDVEKAKRGEYTFAELAWRTDDGWLGTYAGSNLYLRKGRYGLYAEWGDHQTHSLKALDHMDARAIRLADVVDVLTSSATEAAAAASGPTKPQGKSILRVLRSDLSIRKGKYGDYVYHQTTEMRSPVFLPLKPIAATWEQMDDAALIAWIENTYFREDKGVAPPPPPQRKRWAGGGTDGGVSSRRGARK